MIGGGQIDDEVRKYAYADAYGKDAMVAVSLEKDGWKPIDSREEMGGVIPGGKTGRAIQEVVFA